MPKDVTKSSENVLDDLISTASTPYFWTKTCKFSPANSGNLPSATTHIKSVHGKDAYMEHAYSTVIRETMPGSPA